jgi:hypothetical protein
MEDAYVGVPGFGVGKLVDRGIGRGVIIGRFVGFATGSVLVLASGWSLGYVFVWRCGVPWWCWLFD